MRKKGIDVYEEQGDIVCLQSWKWAKESNSNLESLNDINHLEEVKEQNSNLEFLNDIKHLE